MTNVEALKTLYIALGGDAVDVENATTIVEVLNEIAAKYEGADDAVLNPEAIANIASVADNISGGGGGEVSQYANYGSYTENSSNPTGQGTLSKKTGGILLLRPNENGKVSLERNAFATHGGGGTTFSYALVFDEASEIDVTKVVYTLCVTFKASENFSGFKIGGEAVTSTGDAIEAGKWYNAMLWQETVTVEQNNSLGYYDIGN